MPKARRRPTRVATPPVVHPHAAGIDVGATELYVCVPLDHAPQPIRRFGAFTEDLLALAAWLKACGVTAVAMESTGVYWIPLFQILDTQGVEVCLVNARHVKNVPGRKTDVQDCQWLQYLHSVGLLRGSFRPPDAVCAVRTVLRHRARLVDFAAVHTQHMQKALTQMNLQLHHVLSDLTGVTGLAILDALLAGERDPAVLAQHRDPRLKASRETLAKALVGDYRAREHLQTLRQALASFRHYQRLVAECDAEVQALLDRFPSAVDPAAAPLPPDPRPRPRHFASQVDLRTELYRILGVDLTRVPGFASLPLTLFAELGPTLRGVPLQQALRLLGRPLPRQPHLGGPGALREDPAPLKTPRVAQALRTAAQSLHHSQSALGAYFRRMRAKLGSPGHHRHRASARADSLPPPDDAAALRRDPSGRGGGAVPASE